MSDLLKKREITDIDITSAILKRIHQIDARVRSYVTITAVSYTHLKLEQNYRSTQNILNVANALISHNRGRKPKELWTSNREGEPIYFYQALDEKDEAKFVAETIKGMVSKGGAEYRDCAVFYRTHSCLLYTSWWLVVSRWWLVVSG